MSDSKLLHEKDTDLRKAGLKVTGPRIKILEILENSDLRHLSAEAIYQRLRDAGLEVGFATVYRVLTQFQQAGIVTRHNFEGGHSVFELNQGLHHDHLVCERCGQVEEFVDKTIEERQLAIAKKSGYTMTGHSLNIYGICRNCQR